MIMSVTSIRAALCRTTVVRSWTGRRWMETRYLSQGSSSSGGVSGSEVEQSTRKPNWRKQQLQALEKRFSDADHAINKIKEEDDLQPMWREMEGRVARRRSRTLEQNKGKIGRANVKKTDEDVWLQEGLYDGLDDGTKK